MNEHRVWCIETSSLHWKSKLRNVQKEEEDTCGIVLTVLFTDEKLQFSQMG